MASLFSALHVGWYLGMRQIRRAGYGTTALIVMVMTLTFLNLTVVTGVLVGLIDGSSRAYRSQYSADVLISALPDRSFIQRTKDILAAARSLPYTRSVSARYIETGTAESDFNKSLAPGQLPNRVGATIAGIDARDEQRTTGLGDLIVAGRYLDEGSPGEVVVGSGLLKDYARANVPGERYLNADIGDKLRITVHGRSVDVRIRGIVKSKIGDVNQRIYFNDRELSRFIGRDDLNVDEIAVLLRPGSDPVAAKEELSRSDAASYALVQTWEESQGTFFKDVGLTFSILGDLIGSVAVVVAAITVFIVIFVNATNRRKQIGVLKGIGVRGSALVVAYAAQAVAYAVAGSLLGLAVLFGLIKPWFDANPIDFPFSDGILSVTPEGALARTAVLVAIAAAAGALPALMIVRRNTLDTILGR